MGDIISTVLSAISSEPIFVLGIIFFVLSSILKSNKSNDEEQQQDTYETTTTGGMTWEEMERAYGIKIEKKDEDISVVGSSTANSGAIEILHESPSAAEPVPILGTLQSDSLQGGPVVTDTYMQSTSSDTAYDEPAVIISKKKKAKKSAEPTLQERLAAYNRESAAALQMVELAQPDDEHATKVERQEKKQRRPISVKEGMRWSIILDKPKALQMRPR